MRIEIEDPSRRPTVTGPVFFAAGFRPFFLLAGLAAAIGVPAWLLLYTGLAPGSFPYAPMFWHGHEMVWGFAGAAVGGFLLTAVPNWTGAKPLSGRPIQALVGVWMAGRLAMMLAGFLPAWLVAVVDMVFLPLLAALLAQPLIAAAKLRNLMFLPILALLTVANGLVHLELMGLTGTGLAGLHIGVYALVLMIAIIGGRIVPGFTVSGTRMAGRSIADPAVRPWLEYAAPLVVVAAAVADVAAPATLPTSVLLLVAAGLHGLRLAGWRSRAVLDIPLLWVLHAGYAWVVAGLALRGLSGLTPLVPPQAALHALTAGAVGTMILGVMSRAALGHSGRRLVVVPATVWAYRLVLLGALVRTVGPMVTNQAEAAVVVSGLLWCAGFAVFSVVYWPVCTQPRADGRPG